MGRSGKKGANQHNTKHENGIVAPGKRVPKQKSNGHINGSADGKARLENAPSVSAIPSQNLNVPTEATSFEYASSSKSRSFSGSRNSPSRHLSVDDWDEWDQADGTDMVEQPYRKIDVNSVKQTVKAESGPLHLALTVLRSCPIGDTLAILIFLLSLPPTFLHLTNVMFAMITFVPPSGSFTLLPSLTDITSSFSPATPSFIVLVIIDFLAISAWYMVPFPQLQGMLLDCAQATVATTLGGGYNHKPGGSDNILWIVTLVLATHLGRYRKTTLRLLHKTRLTKYLPVVDSFDDMPPRPSYMLGQNKTWLDTIEIWVAIHILCQGLTRMVRRSLHSSRGTSIFSSHSRNTDPEAIPNSQGGGESSETPHNPPSSPSILKSKSSLQNLRDVREKVSSGKRRKKQANYVRSQQPLWAAFAATKATIIREYEQSQATKDARGSNAEGVQNLGSAPFTEEPNRIWITGICPDRFYFETGHMPRGKSCEDAGDDRNEIEDEAGIDSTKHFFVRINSANWASVKMQDVPKSENSSKMLRWVGEVYGLSPTSTYRVSFVRCEDGVELHSEVLVTPSSPIPEQSSTSYPQTKRPSSPASPAATLKTSIAAFESRVNDTLADQKRIRKENKSHVMGLQRELNILTDKLARLANNDKGLTARQLQFTQNIRQAEDSTLNLSEEIEALSEIPEEAMTEWQEQKASWEQIRNEQSRVQEDLQRTKEENRRNHTAVQAEALSARQKKERLQARTTKLTDQHQRLTSSTVTPENRRTYSDQSLRGVERDRAESRYQDQINVLQRSYQDATMRFQAITAQRNNLEQAAENAARMQQAQAAQQARLQYESRPVTPEGDLPGTNPNINNNHTQVYGRFGAFGTPESHSIVPAGSFGSAGTANGMERNASNRRRSQSAISGGGGSVYLETYDDDDEDDDDPIPAQHKRKSGIGSVLEGSDGRSSGSGSPHVPYIPPIRHRGKGSPPAASSN